MNEKVRGKILESALEVINGERVSKHGKPEDSFKHIGMYWEAFFYINFGIKIKLSKSHVCEMLSLFKHARMGGQCHNEDNYRDAAGYLALSNDFHNTQCPMRAPIAPIALPKKGQDDEI